MKKNITLLLTDHLINNHKPNNSFHWNYYLTGFIQSRGKVNLNKEFNKWIKQVNVIIYFDLKDIDLITLFLKLFKGGEILTFTNSLGYLALHLKNAEILVKLYEFTLNKFLQTPGIIVKGDISEISAHMPYSLLISYKLAQCPPPQVCNMFSIDSYSISHYWLTGFLDGVLSKSRKIMKLNIKDSRKPTFPLTNIIFDLDLIIDSLSLTIIFKEILGHNALPTAVVHQNGGHRSRRYIYFHYLFSHYSTITMFSRFYFPDIKLTKFLIHLDSYHLLSHKFIHYLKFRKIYRICQRKEILSKKGLLKIFSIWSAGI